MLIAFFIFDLAMLIRVYVPFEDIIFVRVRIVFTLFGQARGVGHGLVCCKGLRSSVPPVSD